MRNWELSVETVAGDLYSISFEDLEQWKDDTIPVEEYVPRKQAEAVTLQKLLQECSVRWNFNSALFVAEDEFQQEVKREDLEKAFLVFKQKGEPLAKGYPVRLYVPGNESDCLNVKSVVRIVLLNE